MGVGGVGDELCEDYLNKNCFVLPPPETPSHVGILKIQLSDSYPL